MSQNQAPTTTTSPDDRSGEFVAVEGGSEGASAGTLLVAAYLLMWALLLGLVLLTWRKQAKVDSRLDELERALAKSENSPREQ